MIWQVICLLAKPFGSCLLYGHKWYKAVLQPSALALYWMSHNYPPPLLLTFERLKIVLRALELVVCVI